MYIFFKQIKYSYKSGLHNIKFEGDMIILKKEFLKHSLFKKKL